MLLTICLLSGPGFPCAFAQPAPQAAPSSVRESLRKIFGDSVAVTRTTIRLSTGEMQQIARQARSPLAHDSLLIYVCRFGSKEAGYGIVDDVRGKTQLITYLVALLPDGSVKDVDVLAYRESYGGEIRYESFRKQFRQKTGNDQIQVGKDIRNISGATISAHAVTDGVRRLVAAFTLVHRRL